MFLAMLPISVVFFRMVSARHSGLDADMSAISALKAACAAGIRLGGDGDDLVLEAAAPPPLS